MAKIGTLYQTDDWKKEKHVPAIECPDSFPSGEMVPVTVTLGKEVAHPNTTEHHIRWIRVYFRPEESDFAYEVASCEFGAHGASTEGADTSTVYTHHTVTFEFKTEKPGEIFATSFCNIHGLWEDSREIRVV